MLKEERFQIILDQLGHEQKVYLGHLSTLLNVSEDTVRRDIKELADQGLLKSVRGGAVPHSPGPHHFRDRIKYDNEQKQIIAKKTLQFLKDGQVVIFDGHRVHSGRARTCGCPFCGRAFIEGLVRDDR